MSDAIKTVKLDSASPRMIRSASDELLCECFSHSGGNGKQTAAAIVAAINEAAALRAERQATLSTLGPTYAGEFDLPIEKQRPLDSLVSEALAQKEEEASALRERVAEMEVDVEYFKATNAELQALLASTPGALDLQNSSLGQLLVRRNAELERENAALRETNEELVSKFWGTR